VASRRLGEQEPVALARAELEFPDPEATAAPSLQGRPNP
jgi:hypothetical protein